MKRRKDNKTAWLIVVAVYVVFILLSILVTAGLVKIEVGDEVEWTGDKYIVTYINYNIETSEITDYDLLGDGGSVADHVKKCAFVKTGRHFDIASILEEMRT